MLLPIALLLVALFAILAAACLGVKGAAAYLLSLYLLASAEIVLCFEVAGLLGGLGSPLLFLGFESLLALAAGLLWQRVGKPALLAPLAPYIWKPDFGRVWSAVRRRPALALLALGVVLAYAVDAGLILVVPPNNNDSHYLHMARVAHWLQTGSFRPYPTAFTLQLFYPFNAQSLIHWTVLFWGTDQLAGFVQYGAALATMLGVYLLARLLGIKRSQGAFAALVWATLPQVLLQSTTTQNDLVPAAFFIGSLVFFIAGIRSTEPQPGLVLSALGLALALGAKQTVFFLLPGFGCLLVLLAWQRRPARWAFLARWIAAAAAAFILFGACIYVQNTLIYRHPLGDPQFIRTESGLQDDTPPIYALWINLNRVAYQFLDTTGLPPLIEGYLFRGKAHLARSFYASLNLPLESYTAANPKSAAAFDFFRRPPIQEDETWFGILAPLLLVPAALVGLWRSIRRVDPLPAGLWLTTAGFVLCELLLRPGWDIYIGRNFIPALMLLAPFAGLVERPGRLARLVVWLIVLLSIYALGAIVLNNTGKPLTGPQAVWNLSRAEKKTLQCFHYKEPAVLVERHVPAEAVLGIPAGVWEYPFYDRRLQRRLVNIDPPERYGDAAWLRAQGITHLLAGPDSLPPGLPLPLQEVAAGPEWTLYALP